MAALLAYMEFQMEACFQALFQFFITYFYHFGIMAASTNQMISLYQSYATITITMSNVWIPQFVGTRQHVQTLKTKMWQFSLNSMLFFTLLNTLIFSGGTRNHYMQLCVGLLYAGMCITLLLHNKYCKRFKHTNRLKSSLLTFLFLMKLSFNSLYMHDYISPYFDYHIPFHNVLVSQTSITICMDAFFAYIFGKSALNTYSLSSIWNLDPTIISKPLFCTGPFLASFYIVWILFYTISNIVYN